jgi:hypothetical protein
MRRDWPSNAGSLTGFSTGVLDGKPRDRLTGPVAGKQPLSRVSTPPVVAENVQEPGRQHHVTIFAPFARLHTDDHPLAIDGGWPQSDRLGNAQPRRVADCQDHALLQAFHRVQESGDLRGAQHFGKLVRLPAGGDIVLDVPCPPQSDGIEEPKRRHRDRDRTGRQALVSGQVNLPSPDLGRPEKFRRSAKMTSELLTCST